MRILHLSNSQYPATMGGTEIFISRLISAQKDMDSTLDIRWAAHAPDGLDSVEDPEGVQVRLPPVAPQGRLQSMTGSATEIPGFERLLREFEPDVVHLHSFSPQCGLAHAAASKAAGARLVVTVHAPGFSCASGTLVDMNGDVCDGRLRPRRCTSCRLQSAGLPRALAAAVSVQRGGGISTERPDRLSRVVTFRRLVEGFHAGWLMLTSMADAIHVYARWQIPVLRGHGIDVDRIHHVPSAGPGLVPQRSRRAMEDGTLRIVYWGRCEAVKGIHLLIDAVRSLPTSVPVTLDLYTEGWDREYGQSLLRRIGNDARIVRKLPLPQREMLSSLRHYDVAAVPSTWLETGPLTVLEAFAVGLPVAGSPLGGIGELLEGVDGTYLVPPDAGSWGAFLHAMSLDPSPLDRFSPPATRTFGDIAQQLTVLYSPTP